MTTTMTTMTTTMMMLREMKKDDAINNRPSKGLTHIKVQNMFRFDDDDDDVDDAKHIQAWVKIMMMIDCYCHSECVYDNDDDDYFDHR